MKIMSSAISGWLTLLGGPHASTLPLLRSEGVGHCSGHTWPDVQRERYNEMENHYIHEYVANTKSPYCVHMCSMHKVFENQVSVCYARPVLLFQKGVGKPAIPSLASRLDCISCSRIHFKEKYLQYMRGRQGREVSGKMGTMGSRNKAAGQRYGTWLLELDGLARKEAGPAPNPSLVAPSLPAQTYGGREKEDGEIENEQRDKRSRKSKRGMLQKEA